MGNAGDAQSRYELTAKALQQHGIAAIFMQGANVAFDAPEFAVAASVPEPATAAGAAVSDLLARLHRNDGTPLTADDILHMVHSGAGTAIQVGARTAYLTASTQGSLTMLCACPTPPAGALARIAALATQTSDALIVMDDQARLLWVSDGFAELMAVTADHAVSLRLTDIAEPRDLSRLRAELEWRSRVPGPHRPLTFHAQRPDGVRLTVRLDTRNQLDDPAINAIIASVHDVTSATRGARVTAEIGTAVSSHLAGGEAAATTTKLATAAEHYLQARHPHAKVRVRTDIDRLLARARASAHPGEVVRLVLRPSRVFDITGVPDLDDAERALVGRVTGLVKLVIAHSADRLIGMDAAAREQSAFETSPVPTAIIALDGRYVAVNPALVELAATPAADLVGQHWTVLLHPQGPSIPDAPGVGANSHRDNVSTVSHWLLPDGQEKWVVIYSGVVRDHDGKLLYHLVQHHDITADRALTDELASVNDVLRRDLDDSGAERHRLTKLLTEVTEDRERERAEVANRLTEEVVQQLVGTRFALDRLPFSANDPDVAHLHRSLDEAISELRAAATTMRPASLDLFGLEESVRQTLNDATAAGLEVHADVDPLPRLDPAQETLLYRLVTACVALSLRPTSASLFVTLKLDRHRVHLLMTDDGPGDLPDTEDARRNRAALDSLTELVVAKGGGVYRGLRRDHGPGRELAVDLPVTRPDADPGDI